MDERLNCEKLEQRINDLLDLRLPVEQDQAINQHIQFCDECRETVRYHQILHQHIEQSSQTDDMEVDVSDSVVITWAHMFPDPKTPAWRTSSLIAVVCLLLLVPVGLVWMSQSLTPKNPVANASLPANRSGSSTQEANTDLSNTISSLQQFIGTADQQLEALKPYRPTFHLLGVATVWESIDMTLDLLLQQIPVPKKQDDPKTDNLKSLRIYNQQRLA